jgi:S1-C subfamily serine protease/HEAT repeat protein/ribosomal protein S27E
MLQVKCPQCQNVMGLATVPSSGQVACSRCGQQLLVPVAAKPVIVPQVKPVASVRVVPQHPDVVEEAIDLGTAAAPRRAVSRQPVARTVPPPQPPTIVASPVHATPHRTTEASRGTRKKKRSINPGLLVAGGSVATLVLVGIVALIYISVGGDNAKEQTPQPVVLAQNTQQPRPRVQEPSVDSRPAPAKETPRPAEPERKTPPPPEKEVAKTPGKPADTGGQETAQEPGTTSEQPPNFGGGSRDSGGGGVDVYPYVLKSATFIVVMSKDGKSGGAGSGALIDRKNRLILTNHHVAGEAGRIAIFFPTYDKSGKLIVEKERFLKQALSNSKVLEGRVFASDKKKDLCLVQVDRLPSGVEGLPIAKESCKVGQRVHSVGNPGASGGLWVYAPGVVRTLYHKKWIAIGGGTKRSEHEADIIETQSPTNPGDSGGPLVNDRGELVGVTQGGSAGGGLSSVSIFIDVGEVQRFVDNAVQSHLRVAWAPDARAPMRVASAAPTGNIADLVKGLMHSEASVRARSAETLGEMGERAKDAIPSLLKLLNDPDEFTRRMVASALSKIGLPAKSDVPLLAKSLGDPSVDLRRYAATTLEKMGSDSRGALNEMAAALSDNDPGVRQALARALGRFGRDAKDRAQRSLEEMLSDSDRDTRLAAAEGLAGILVASADVEPLKKLVKHEDSEVRVAVAKALPKLGKAARPFLAEVLEAARQDTGDLRRAALQVLAVVEPTDAKAGAELITEALKNGDKETKTAALAALGNVAKDAPPAAVNAARDAVQEQELRAAAMECLIKLAPHHKVAVTSLVDLAKEGDETGEAAAKAIGELGSAALPALADLIRHMDTPGNTVTPADRERVEKFSTLIAKIGKPAVPMLRKGLVKQGTQRWGCAKALGKIGPPAKEALRELQILSATEINGFIRVDVEEAIRNITNR